MTLRAASMERASAWNDSTMMYSLARGRRVSLGKEIDWQGHCLAHSHGTAVRVSRDETVALIGYCVDSCAQIAPHEMAEFLASGLSSVEDLLLRACPLAGCYVVLAAVAGDIVCFTDPGGYAQINFHTEFHGIASSEKLIGDAFSLAISDRSRRIRDGAHPSQPLPNDLTMYDQVKAVLPNHWLGLGSKRVSRYFPGQELRGSLRVESVVEHTYSRVLNITRAYLRDFDVICPLTGGADSRLNLAFLKKARSNGPVRSFTLRHPRLSKSSDDVIIPIKLAAALGIEHELVEDLRAPDAFVQKIHDGCGNWHSRETIDLAYTIKTVLPERGAILNGDIIDQIGKSLIGNSVPEVCATKAFFACKMHNHSWEAREEIGKWQKKIVDQGSTGVSQFDLFAWENRIGRWAAQSSLLYATAGVVSLNIYNCRDVIEPWLRLPRKLRKQLVLHRGLLRRLVAEVADWPFNPKGRVVRIGKSAWPVFLAATHAKQGLGRHLRR